MFVGDNGQGDARAAELMAAASSPRGGRLERAYIHIVQPIDRTHRGRHHSDPESAREAWDKAGVVFVETFVDAALDACSRKFISPLGLRRGPAEGGGRGFVPALLRPRQREGPERPARRHAEEAKESWCGGCFGSHVTGNVHNSYVTLPTLVGLRRASKGRETVHISLKTRVPAKNVSFLRPNSSLCTARPIWSAAARRLALRGAEKNCKLRLLVACGELPKAARPTAAPRVES